METNQDPVSAGLLLTTTEAAHRLGIKRAKLTEMIRNDEIAAISSGGRYHVPERVVTECLDAQLTGTPSGIKAADVVEFMARTILKEMPQLLSIDGAAEFLGMGPHRVRDAVARGDIPSIPWGAHRMVPTAQLVALLAGAA